MGGDGVPARSTQCGSTVVPSGKIPPASGDDAANINAAISACTAGQVVKLGAGTFQLAQSESISLNQGITLRGTGTCNNASSPYCSTIINVYNGAIPDWLISPTQTGAMCGVTAASASACTANGPVILVAPSGNFDQGWAGCQIAAGINPTTSNCGTTLAADVAQGATTVQVASTANFSVGMWVLMDEDPKVVSLANPTGGANFNGSADLFSTSDMPATMRLEDGDIPGAWSFGNRVNAELHLVTAIGAGPCPGSNCTLTFDDPITLAFRQSGSHDARVYWPTHCCSATAALPFLNYAGVENLSLTKAAAGGVQFFFCAYCWVKNVEVGTWISGAMDTDYSARVQIEFNYLHDCADCESSGAEYPLQIDSASTETYVVNNIILKSGKGMVAKASNTGVIAYNYVDETFYMHSAIGDYWIELGLNASHYAGTHHFLFEGNWGPNCDGDETHGNSIYQVFFRNDCAGLRTPFTDPSINKTVNDAAGIGYFGGGGATTPSPRRAAGPMAFNYWYSFVGNVLGTAGQSTTANGWVYRCQNNPGDQCIFMSGWTGSEWPGPDPHLAASSNNFILIDGNYDYVNAAVTWASSDTQHLLPNSLYIPTKPAFFSAGSCTYPWPWVTPTGTSQLQKNSCGGSGLPALARWNAGTPFVQP